MIDIIIAAGGSSNAFNVIAWIAIPLFIAFCGGLVAAFKGATRFGQYMAKSEETQDSIATSNKEIADKLEKFIDRTNIRLSIHDQDIAVIKYAIDRHGSLPWPIPPLPNDPGDRSNSSSPPPA